MQVNEQSVTKRDAIEFALLILAAGSSSRMGKSKQLLIINNKPLLRKTVDVALESNLGRVVVVLGANAQEHNQVLQNAPIDIIVHPDWIEGMGSSLKAGVRFIENMYAQVNGIIVMVCDQPFLSTSHLIQLLKMHHESAKPIVASSYGGTLGVPCFFDGRFIPHILKLGNEEGAKKLVKLFNDDVASVEFTQGEIDLDTPEDLQKLL